MKTNHPFHEKSPTDILTMYRRYRAGEKVRILLDE